MSGMRRAFLLVASVWNGMGLLRRSGDFVSMAAGRIRLRAVAPNIGNS